MAINFGLATHWTEMNKINKHTPKFHWLSNFDDYQIKSAIGKYL